jgi:HrpA-like RNA helicase
MSSNTDFNKEILPYLKKFSRQMLSIGIKNVSTFDFLEPPPQESVDSALRQLLLLGAVAKEAKPDNQQVNGGGLK